MTGSPKQQMLQAVTDDPSQRLVDQRIRNRMMEALEILARGDDAVREMGPSEYFEQFYDWAPHRDSRPAPPNGALTEIERTMLAAVGAMLDDACDATPRLVLIDEFVASGWPKRIQPFARAALDAMALRGRFSEDFEELTPMSRPKSRDP